MDSDLSPAQENNEPKAEFRKLSNEATNRKYRRHSSASGSSEEDGSPKRDHISRGSSKTSNYERRNYDKVDDRISSRSQHGRSNDSYRHFSRGNRHDDHSRYGKHADEDDRSFAKPSDRSGRESRGGAKKDYRDRDSDYNRSRDRYRDVDRYPRDRYDRTRYDGRHGGRYDDRDRHSRDKDHNQDERKEYRGSRDHRGDRMSYEDSKGHQGESISEKEFGNMKDLDCSKYNQENSKTEGPEDFAAKRPKFSLGIDSKKDEKLLSASKQGDDLAAKVSPERGPVSGAGSVLSVNDATVRAIKAAQSVNQDLTSTGFMTAINPKKKLLWADKKSKATEESSNHWDAAHFTDRERQEKFYKLMSLSLPWYIWPIVGCEGRSERGSKTSEQPRCREAERTSAGFREAVHCWSEAKRWPHCRFRSVKFHLGSFLSADKFLSRCFMCLFYVRLLVRVALIYYPLKVMRNSRLLQCCLLAIVYSFPLIVCHVCLAVLFKFDIS